MKITLEDSFHKVEIECKETTEQETVIAWLDLFKQAMGGLGFADYDYHYSDKSPNGDAFQF
jgi:hypothetical protein